MDTTKARTFLLGQVLSVLLTCAGYFSHNVHDAGFNCPTLQSSLNYLLLAFYCTCISRDGLHAPWWRYVILAVVDVEANYFIVKSFQYTSTTSILLLDSFAIPCVMLASILSPMKAVYSNEHLSGVSICVLGLILTVICDTVSNGNSGIFPEAWKGDLMCLVGASLYGLSNVLQEDLLKEHGQRTEVLGILGVFGFLISGSQAALLESRGFGELTQDAFVNIIGYQLALFSMYSLMSVFLYRCDACLFNLSLLTSDLYTIVIASVLWKEHFMPAYLGSFFLTLFGLVQYHRGPTPTSSATRTAIGRAACAQEPLISPSTEASDVEPRLTEGRELR
eukprot:GEMP01019865.1.p1 GENE.GEMP01019865.1~~GEMP01019865.1.p1  ORF type:complete len:335 (+),score=50.15 GEMP01019865.1:87-1091(+)